MIDLPAVLAVSLVSLVAMMSPGPNFVAVTHRAVSSHRAEALALVGGIACVSTLWAAAALFGLGMIFALFPWMFWAVKIMGAAYLVWFGVQLIRRSALPLASKSILVTQSTCARAFRDGVVTNLSNPKSMAFYASVFSSAVPVGATQQTMLMMVSAVLLNGLLWYGSLAFILSGENAANLYRKAKPVIERSCGFLLIVFGLRQALVRA